MRCTGLVTIRPHLSWVPRAYAFADDLVPTSLRTGAAVDITAFLSQTPHRHCIQCRNLLQQPNEVQLPSGSSDSKGRAITDDEDHHSMSREMPCQFHVRTFRPVILLFSHSNSCRDWLMSNSFIVLEKLNRQQSAFACSISRHSSRLIRCGGNLKHEMPVRQPLSASEIRQPRTSFISLDGTWARIFCNS